MDRLSFLQNHFLYTTIVIFIGISCIFHTSPIVLFRPSKSRSNEDDEAFTGNLRNADELQVSVDD